MPRPLEINSIYLYLDQPFLCFLYLDFVRSGEWDNPFQPEGRLNREAEIVLKLWREGGELTGRSHKGNDGKARSEEETKVTAGSDRCGWSNQRNAEKNSDSRNSNTGVPSFASAARKMSTMGKESGVFFVQNGDKVHNETEDGSLDNMKGLVIENEKLVEVPKILLCSPLNGMKNINNKPKSALTVEQIQKTCKIM